MIKYSARLVFLIAMLLVVSITAVVAIDAEVETYTLPNGMTIILHEDHSLPRVTINTWFAVGSKDEAEGRSGFAHLFEHLMFMGTFRVPDNQYDVQMENGGGANNASTSTDRTNYYSWGPSELLPTLLWLDADRLEALGSAMTQEKLDLQREVVRNERRQVLENTPYGKAREIIPAAMYPEGHPYHDSVIGSHEDLEAATVDDVKHFFATYYVPSNASLVVAGDFDPAAVKKVISETFGAVPAAPAPLHSTVAKVELDREVRRVAVDRVQYPRLYLVWHSPALFEDGDAELDLVAELLAGDDSSLLHRKLVIDERLAQNVVASQDSMQLSSQFQIVITAAPGANLEQLKSKTLQVIEDLKKNGPTAAELSRVKAGYETWFLRGMESLDRRADQLNRYRHYLGKANSFAFDLARYTDAGAESVKNWANRVFGEGRLDLRILPQEAVVAGADLDRKPDPFPGGDFVHPIPVEFELPNGLKVHALSRPGTGLFTAEMLVDGGERLVPASRAGLSTLAASLLTSGANGRNASEFAEAVATLGGSITADAGRDYFSVYVSGLASRLGQTLDLFADAILRADLEQDDFDREKDLLLADIKARADNPGVLAGLAATATLFGRDDFRGRPTGGYAETVGSISRDDIRKWVPKLLNPHAGELIICGDFDIAALHRELEQRFGKWRAPKIAPRPRPAPLVDPGEQRTLLIDRPGAPQTVLFMLRPVPAVSNDGRAVRESINVLFGGSFTSRLNQNLRERNGYTYGAGSTFMQSHDQHLMYAFSRVQTEVTGPALVEFRNEFNRLASGDVSDEELTKAVKTARQEVIDGAGTTGSLLAVLSDLIATGRPLDDIGGYLDALGGVTLKDANQTAASGLYDWDKLMIVLVGDRAKVVPQMVEAGFAEPEILDQAGLM